MERPILGQMLNKSHQYHVVSSKNGSKLTRQVRRSAP